MKKNSLIIHIGLGKTATTTFQKYFFPTLCQAKGFIYNPPEFLKILSQALLYSNQQKTDLIDVLSKNNSLISSESLFGWNPRTWEINADRVLDLFGRDAKIILTIRDPLEYLTSHYLQMVKAGIVIQPSDFFLTAEDYTRMGPFLCERTWNRFDHDAFNLELLERLYQDRFDEVYIVPVTRYNTLYPWAKLFTLANDEILFYQKILANCPRENRAYSSAAVWLTFARQRLLQFYDLRLVCIQDNEMLFAQGILPRLVPSFSTLSFYQKVKAFVPRVLSRFLRLTRWEILMTLLDKVIPYKKYQLPLHSVSFDPELMEKNRRFVRKYEDLLS